MSSNSNTFRPRLPMMESSEVDEIIHEAIQILEKVGILVENEDARALLKDAGVVEKNSRFYMSEKLVRDSLEISPSHYYLYDRDEKPILELGSDDTCFYPGATAVNLYDVGAGKRRDPLAKDLVNLIRLVDELPNYGCQGTAVLPKDIIAEVGDRYRLYLVLKYSTKPVVTGTFRKDGFGPMLEMMTAVRGNREKLAEKPLGLFICCPSPPLKWSDLTCQALIDCARAGVPSIPLSMPITGATGAVTLRETVVQHCAENFSGIVIAQLAQKGTPVVFGGAPSAFDMRSGTTIMGAIETGMICVAYGQVAKRLGLPTHCYLGASDSKLPDYQAGMESALGIMLASLSGINFAAGPGMLDFLLTHSLEKIILDHEACGMAKRLVRGIGKTPVDLIPLMEDLIKTGELLKSKHTRANWRAELSMQSPLVDRNSYGEWEKGGSKDILTRAHEECEQRAMRPVKSLIDPERLAKLEHIMQREVATYGGQLPQEL